MPYPKRPTLVIIGELPPPLNGQSKNLQSISADLSRTNKYNVVLHSISNGRLSGSIVGHSKKSAKHVAGWIKLAKYTFSKNKYAYIVADGGKGLIYTIAILLITRILRYRTILQHRTFGYIDKPNTLMRISNILLGANGMHVFLSEGMAQKFFNKYSPKRKYRANHNLAQSADFWKKCRNLPQQKNEILKIGFMSNLSTEKGLDTFLEIAAQSEKENLEINYLLAGPVVAHADKIKIEKFVQTHKNLEWIGSVNGEDKTKFFRSIDIFLFPTHYKFEAQPNVILEAMCAGNYVIATDRGCIAEDIENIGGACIPREHENDKRYWLEKIKIVIGDRNSLRTERAKVLTNTNSMLKKTMTEYESFLDTLF